MKAKNFKYQTSIYAKDQPEYLPLPAIKIEGSEGYVVFCMGLSFWERIRILFLGEVWVSLMTFNKPLTPSFLSTKRKECFSHPDDDINKWQRFINLGAIIYLTKN